MDVERRLGQSTRVGRCRAAAPHAAALQLSAAFTLARAGQLPDAVVATSPHPLHLDPLRPRRVLLRIARTTRAHRPVIRDFCSTHTCERPVHTGGGGIEQHQRKQPQRHWQRSLCSSRGWPHAGRVHSDRVQHSGLRVSVAQFSHSDSNGPMAAAAGVGEEDSAQSSLRVDIVSTFASLAGGKSFLSAQDVFEGLHRATNRDRLVLAAAALALAALCGWLFGHYWIQWRRFRQRAVKSEEDAMPEQLPFIEP